MAKTKHTSVGEMISSLCFFGVGVWLIGEALINPPLLKQLSLMVCGVLSLLAAFRFHIGRLAHALQKIDD